MRQRFCSGNPSRRADFQSSENTMEKTFGGSSSGNAAQTVDTPSSQSRKASISNITLVLTKKNERRITESTDRILNM